MIRFRFGGQVPNGAANLAFIPITPAAPDTHLTLSDFSTDISENIADNYGTDVNLIVDPTGSPAVASPERADTRKLLVSNRSILSRNVTRPVKLFYEKTLDLLVFDTEASESDLDAARETIRKRITILDGRFDRSNDLQWDIEVDATGAPANSFQVTLYSDRVGRQGQTFVAQYDAVNTGGDRFPNNREVLNSTPILEDGTDFVLVDRSATLPAPSFEVTSLANQDLAPGIGLFYDVDTGFGEATISATDISITDGTDVATVGLLVGGSYRPVRDVVADINAANVQVTAVPLSDSKRAQLVVQTVIIPRTGVVLRHDRLAHIRYTDQLRIRAMRPRARSAREAWFPRVLNGAFTQRSGGDTYRYEIHDYHYQIFHQTYGEPYRAVLDEEPVALSNKRWRLSRAPIRSRGDIRIFIDEVEDNSVLDQVDLNNGILFLNRTLDPNADLRISYVYEDTSFTYTDINLNPTLRHNPIFLGKYVGLYILPRTIVTPSMAGAPTPWTVTNRERTVFHVMRNSAQEIINLVPTMVLSDGSSAHALLLAIYHVRQTTDPEDDIEIVDTRQAGGGLRPDLGPADVDEEEAEFYADVGGHFDGEPFPDAATLVVEIAETIPLDATGEVCRVDLYDSVGSTGVIDPSGWVDPSGILTRDEIHQKILRHVDAGAFVVEDYYLE